MRCDKGNTFGTGCQYERAYKVERHFRDGGTTVSHECKDHAREALQQLDLFREIVGVDLTALKEPADEA